MTRMHGQSASRDTHIYIYIFVYIYIYIVNIYAYIYIYTHILYLYHTQQTLPWLGSKNDPRPVTQTSLPRQVLALGGCPRCPWRRRDPYHARSWVGGLWIQCVLQCVLPYVAQCVCSFVSMVPVHSVCVAVCVVVCSFVSRVPVRSWAGCLCVCAAVHVAVCSFESRQSVATNIQMNHATHMTASIGSYEFLL